MIIWNSTYLDSWTHSSSTHMGSSCCSDTHWTACLLKGGLWRRWLPGSLDVPLASYSGYSEYLLPCGYFWWTSTFYLLMIIFLSCWWSCSSSSVRRCYRGIAGPRSRAAAFLSCLAPLFYLYQGFLWRLTCPSPCSCHFWTNFCRFCRSFPAWHPLDCYNYSCFWNSFGWIWRFRIGQMLCWNFEYSRGTAHFPP